MMNLCGMETHKKQIIDLKKEHLLKFTDLIAEIKKNERDSYNNVSKYDEI